MTAAAMLRAQHGREPVSSYVDERWSLMAMNAGGVPYRLVGRTAITVGAPLTRPEDSGDAASAFVGHCASHGWRPVFFQTAHPVEGLRSHLIAREAMLDVAGFSLAGARMANVRHSSTRARRAGVGVTWTRWSDAGATLRAEIERVSLQWSRHRPQLTFTYGRFDDVPGDALLGVAAVPDGRVEAFVTLRRLSPARGLVLDLIRRRADAVPGTMELLLCEAVEAARGEGHPWLSLGAAGAEVRGPWWLAAAMRRTERWNATGLERFKAKFHPRWENRYLAVAPGAGPISLGAVALAHLHQGAAAAED